ncbi:MAG: phosphatidate cytidylyltransferase, partial [Anaerolineae bacterium]|nr:phosphatidate cytidylyltransferase [Anaerolineae bacterium]
MLKTRALVAVIALPILLVVILAGGWWFALLVFGALLLAGDEYTRLLRQGDLHPPEWLVLGLITLAMVSTWFENPDWRDPGIALLLIAGTFTVIWDMEHGRMRPTPGLALAVFGGIYLGWLGSYLLAVRMLEDGAYLTIVLYGCVIV